MVLVLGNDATLSSVADAVVVGAKRVRFTEVSVRALHGDAARYRGLGSHESLSSYDGVVFVAGDDESAALEIGRVSGGKALTNTVVARAGGDAALSVAIVESGGIVVSVPKDSSCEAHATALGERVAKVAGWVRHSLGHEAEHQHDSHHHQDHGRGHDDGHEHGHDHSRDHAKYRHG